MWYVEQVAKKRSNELRREKMTKNVNKMTELTLNMPL